MDKKAFLLCFIFSLSIVCTVQAEDLKKRQPLVTGMSYVEVLKSWGEPKEKLEYEIKREDSWVYPEGTVKFKNGHVVQVIQANPAEESNLLISLTNNKPNQTVKAVSDDKLKPQPTEDWGAYEPIKDGLSIRDLLKDVSADNEKKLPPPGRNTLRRSPIHRY